MQLEEHAMMDANGGRSGTAMTRFSAIGTAIILVGFLVMSVSRAAFVATTDNIDNYAETGQLTLTDNDLGVAMFPEVGAATMTDGDSMESCITVTYAGDYDPNAVKVYLASATGGLAPHLSVKIEQSTIVGITAGFDNCLGFVAESILYDGPLPALGGDYTNGVGTWDPTDTLDLTRSYRFTVTVTPVNGGGAGSTADFGFTWETQGG